VQPAAPLGPFDALRRLAHVGVAFVSLFLVVRTAVLEPFGVPTGSMAVALFGNRREAPCPRCGYPVRAGAPARERAARFDDCRCPNCAAPVDLTDAPEVSGDRLLVDKTAFDFRPPRRWEVAVFRCPVDLTKPYVKRVVGLPGEAVQVIEGDAYADGALLRKTLAEVRATRVPVFDLRYAPPGPVGWGVRFLVEPVAGDPATARGPSVPAGPDVLKDGVLTLDASADPNAGVGLTYHHWHLDVRDDDPVKDGLPYNDAAPLSRRAGPAHDFVLDCDVEVVGGAGSFAARLGDGGDFVSAEVPVGPGAATLTAGADVATGSGRLVPGRTHHLEFAFVDRRASLAIDGQEVVPPLDLAAKVGRGAVRKPLQLGARGALVRVKNLRLFRDIHYRADGANGTKSPCRLGPGEYFMLGDNSPDSHDSRGWAVPGVPGRDLVGKPFLVHQPVRPGRVTVGGRERTVQTVDWDRLRWLR
jgi:signal peptidase I